MTRLLPLLLLASCVSLDPLPDPVPPDAGCADLCEHGRESACDWAQDTEDGEPCESVCSDLEALLPGRFAQSVEQESCR